MARQARHPRPGQHQPRHPAAYSPELNPVERVWLYLRETYLSLRLLDDYDAVVEACCQAWCNLTPDRLRSLTAYPYLHGITG